MKLLTGLEVRAEGRTLEGIVMNYGEVSPSHRERFLPGSIVRDGDVDVWLDLAHNPLQVVAYEGAGLEFDRQRPISLTMRAVLPRIPAAELALEGVRSGRRNGLSVEFKLLEQRNGKRHQSGFPRPAVGHRAGRSPQLSAEPDHSPSKRQRETPDMAVTLTEEQAVAGHLRPAISIETNARVSDRLGCRRS